MRACLAAGFSGATGGSKSGRVLEVGSWLPSSVAAVLARCRGLRADEGTWEERTDILSPG